MEFALTAEQEAITENVAKLCEDFDDDYWLSHDDTGTFPHDFHPGDGKGGLAWYCHA